LIIRILDKQVTLIGCASRHSTCATACWHHSGNCVVLMTRLWMIAILYCNVCSRQWKNSLSCISVQSATAGLSGSDISSSGVCADLYCFQPKVQNGTCFLSRHSWLTKMTQT